MNQKILIFVSIIFCSWWLFAKQVDSPFIAKKKIRGLSKSKLKEQSAQELGSILQSLPGLIKSIAHIQECAMHKLTQYLEGEKDCFWSKFSCEQLLVCKNNIQTFNERIEQIHGQLEQFIGVLDNMNISDGAKSDIKK